MESTRLEPPAFSPGLPPGAPARVGPYRIIATLGQGGMGVVYLAEQLEPVRREVAIKILKGEVDSDLVVARFDMERQALAVMEHPGITKVFDAGITESGSPYFVMERVSGVPLTEYADAHRLDIEARVRLFAQVCRAVQHAHQKGIIHRDLKPSNVLVTQSDGAPLCKIIDFGIAKATQAAAAKLTQTGITIGTPAYMSPEQALSEEFTVDTRSDVYSLGVMLYELLSGVLPFDPDVHGLLGVMMRHASEDPKAPSVRVAALPAERQETIALLRRLDTGGLRRALAGDLDWITLKALEKARERRYETAVAFAEDLDRFVAQQPVIASPLSGAYRMRKFARRHRLGVAFAATVALMVVGFAIAVTFQARRLALARAVAVQRRTQADSLIGFMVGDLHERLKGVGRLDLFTEVGKRAETYFSAVSESDLSDSELFRLAQSVEQLGEIQNERGDFDAAMRLFRRSLVLADAAVRRDTMNGDWQLGLGASHFWIGYVHWRHNELDSALAHFVPYLRITEALVARAPDSLHYRNELGQANSNIGSVKESRGDLPGALAAFQAAIAAKQYAADHDTSKLAWQLDLADAYNSAAVIQRKVGDIAGAERSHRAELATKEGLVARDTANKLYRTRLASAHSFIGELLTIEGDTASALRELTMSRDLYASLAAADTTNPERRRILGIAYRLIGVTSLERGDARGALRALDQSARLLDPRVARTPNNALWQTTLARSLTLQGLAISETGRAAEGESLERRALSIIEPALAKKPTDQGLRLGEADAYLYLGEILAKSNHAAAKAAWTTALATIDSLARTLRITDHLGTQSMVLLRLDRVGEATPIVQELLRRGYRRPRWMALVREKKAVPVPP